MTNVRKIFDGWFPRGGLRRSASILAGGTVIAQAIAALLSPILTRVYQVSDFGYQQVFSSIVALLLVITAGRYELAIPLPEDDEIAINLLAFAVFLVGLTSVLLMFPIITVVPHQPWILEHAGKLSPYLWLLPFCVAGAGLYQVLSYWSLRKKRFATISRTRIIQVGSRFSIQAVAGLFKLGLFGLLIGETVARANGCGSFAKDFLRENRPLLRKITWSRMLSAAKRYKNFPLVLSGGALLNSVTLAIPGLLLAALFGAKITGWFALVDRILGAPSALVGSSLLQVYISEGAPLVNSNPRALKSLFFRMVRKIYLMPLVFCCILLVFGPSLFAFVFGPDWKEAGDYARILCFVHVAGFLFAPVEMTLTMLELQSWQLGWDLGRLILVSASMFFAHRIFPGPRVVIAAYAASMMLAYIAYLLMSYLAINRQVNRWELQKLG